MGWERADRIKSVFVKGQSFDLPSLMGSEALAGRYAEGAVVLSKERFWKAEIDFLHGFIRDAMKI